MHLGIDFPWCKRNHVSAANLYLVEEKLPFSTLGGNLHIFTSLESNYWQQWRNPHGAYQALAGEGNLQVHQEESLPNFTLHIEQQKNSEFHFFKQERQASVPP